MLAEEMLSKKSRLLNLLQRLWKAVYAVGKDGMLIDAILKSCTYLVARCNRIEEDAALARYRELYRLSLEPECPAAIIQLNTLQLHRDPGSRWDNLCYDIDELTLDQDLLTFYAPKSDDRDWRIILGHKVHVLSHNKVCQTEFDEVIEAACKVCELIYSADRMIWMMQVRWLIVKLVFGIQLPGSEDADAEKDVDQLADAMLENETSNPSGQRQCVFRPKIDGVYNLLCANSDIYQAIHISAHESEQLKNKARMTLAARTFKQYGDSRSLAQLNRAKDRSLELMDAEIPALANQDYQVMQSLFTSTISFISLIFAASTSHFDWLSVAAALSPWCEIVRMIRLGDPNGRRPHIENILFDLVRNPSDDVKIGAIMCLSHMRSEKFEPEATEQMVNLLSQCSNASETNLES